MREWVDPFKEIRDEMTTARSLVMHKAAVYDQVEYIQLEVNWQEVLDYTDALGGQREALLDHSMVSETRVPSVVLDAARRRTMKGGLWWSRKVSTDGPVDDGVRL